MRNFFGSLKARAQSRTSCGMRLRENGGTWKIARSMSLPLRSSQQGSVFRVCVRSDLQLESPPRLLQRVAPRNSQLAPAYHQSNATCSAWILRHSTLLHAEQGQSWLEWHRMRTDSYRRRLRGSNKAQALLGAARRGHRIARQAAAPAVIAGCRDGISDAIREDSCRSC